MRRVPVEQLQIGMVIGKAVCTGDGSMLFTPGTVIEAGHLKQLLDAGVACVEIKDGDTGVKENKLTRSEITRTVRNIFKDITLTNPLEQGAVKQTVNDMLRQVLKNRCVMLHLTEFRGSDLYVFSHSVNVCMLALIVGLFMNLKRDQLKNLGLAALLHDVGRNKVPKSILYKPAPLSELEYAQVKKHTVYGYEMLKRYNQIPEQVCLAALQHHERLDGSGYPHGLVGEEIDLFARIVAVADVFDALLTDRPFRKGFFPHQAVDIILNSAGQFDQEVMRVFTENVAIYPLGSVVSLNNGEIGVVVDVNRSHRTRPVVRIMYDRDAQKLAFIKEIDLSKSSDIYITRILREEQVENIIG